MRDGCRIWKQAAAFAKMNRNSKKIKIPGLKIEPHAYQLLAAYWVHLTAREKTLGVYLADTIGLGKVSQNKCRYRSPLHLADTKFLTPGSRHSRRYSFLQLKPTFNLPGLTSMSPGNPTTRKLWKSIYPKEQETSHKMRTPSVQQIRSSTPVLVWKQALQENYTY